MSVSRVSWVVVVFMLVTAACGSSDPSASDPTPAVTAEPTVLATTPSPDLSEAAESQPTSEPEPRSTATPVETPTPPVAPTPERFLASEIVVEGTPGDPAYEAQVALVGAWRVFQAAAADPTNYNPEELAVFIDEGGPEWERLHAGLLKIEREGVAYRYPPESHREIVDVVIDSDRTARVAACIVDAAVRYEVDSGDEEPVNVTSYSVYDVQQSPKGWTVSITRGNPKSDGSHVLRPGDLRMSRLRMTLAIAVVLLLGMPAQASAQGESDTDFPEVDTEVDEGGIGAGATVDGGTTDNTDGLPPSTEGDGETSEPVDVSGTCADPNYFDTERCLEENGGSDGPPEPCVTAPTEVDGSNVGTPQCPGGDTTIPVGSLPPPPPPPDPEELAEEAFANEPWPELVLATGPGDTGTVYAMFPYSLALNSDAWSWDTISASVSLRGLTVSVYARPKQVVWDTGPINSHPSPNRAHLRYVTCEANGSATWQGGSQWDGVDLAPGGPDCLTMWYGTDSLAGGPISISADLEWTVWWEASDGATSGPDWRTYTTSYSRGDINVFEIDGFYNSKTNDE